LVGYSWKVKIKQVMMAAVIGTSAIAFMIHRLPRKFETAEKPIDVKRPIVSLHSTKTRKIASTRKNSKHHKSATDTQLSSRNLFG
jgi:hypothetical protein